MNTWVDIVGKIGIPCALLGLTYWKVWPLLLSFISDMKAQRVAADKRWVEGQQELKSQQTEFRAHLKSQHDDFLKALDGYNAANMQTAKELGNVAQAVKELAQSPNAKATGTPRRI